MIGPFQSQWLGDRTKERVLEKARAMQIQIGQSDQEYGNQMRSMSDLRPDQITDLVNFDDFSNSFDYVYDPDTNRPSIVLAAETKEKWRNLHKQVISKFS